jgi:hypothetical protein
MKKIMIAAMVMIGFSSSAQQALGEVQGYVFDKATNESIPYVRVFIKDFDKLYQIDTDDEGMFRISAIPAGTYTLNIRYMDDTIKVEPIQVKMNSLTQLGKIELNLNEIMLGNLIVRPGLRLIEGDLPIPQMTGEEIARSVGKFNPKSLIASMSSEVRLTEDGELVFRGARKGDMIYMIDGIKANDVVNVPSVSIGNMMVYTGALPAKYGDTLGGVVVVETKSYFDLYRAWMAGR